MKWEKLHKGIDILVTHGPPKGVLDRCDDGYRAGCQHLMNKVNEIKPDIHVFGHIHEDGGKVEDCDDTMFINASVLDLQYNKSNNGHVIDYEKTR